MLALTAILMQHISTQLRIANFDKYGEITTNELFQISLQTVTFCFQSMKRHIKEILKILVKLVCEC